MVVFLVFTLDFHNNSNYIMLILLIPMTRKQIIKYLKEDSLMHDSLKYSKSLKYPHKG